MQGAVPKFGFAYYQTFMNDPKADLKVTVEAIFGDPDLFISRTDQRPDQVNHTCFSISPLCPPYISPKSPLYLPRPGEPHLVLR